MPAAMPCSRWSVLPARTMSMHRISRSPLRKLKSRRSRLARSNSDRRASRRSTDRSASASHRTELSVTLSASLRAELRREIEALTSADDAALWAHRRLAAKDQLSAADAQQVEEAFAAKLAAIPAQKRKNRRSCGETRRSKRSREDRCTTDRQKRSRLPRTTPSS